MSKSSDTGLGATTEYGNIGSGAVRDVSDRKPSNPLTPDRDSVERSLRDKGLNECTMNESMAEVLGHGVDITGDTDSDGEFDGQVNSLRGLGRGQD